MVLINGVKYACERCIRGHRVSNCKHADQPLTMIKPKGRPTTQCSHCREARKNRLLHTKCLCGVGQNGKHADNCPCAIDSSKCTCTKNVGRAPSRSRRSQANLSRTASVSSVSSSPAPKEERHDSPVGDSASSVRSLDLGMPFTGPIYESDIELWPQFDQNQLMPQQPVQHSSEQSQQQNLSFPPQVLPSGLVSQQELQHAQRAQQVPQVQRAQQIHQVQQAQNQPKEDLTGLYDTISDQPSSQMFPMAYSEPAAASLVADDLYGQWLESINVDPLSSNASVLSHNDEDSLFELVPNQMAGASSQSDGWTKHSPKPILMPASSSTFWSEDEALSPRRASKDSMVVSGFWDYVSS